MQKNLNARPLATAETARLFDEVADSLERAAALGDPCVRLVIQGDYPAGGRAAAAGHPPNADDHRAMRRAAARLEGSLHRLHASGGRLACETRGASGGAFLEIALMADAHAMEAGASLCPAGLFDGHVPAAGGWSRLIERAGAGRAAGLLLSRQRLGAAEALAAGLCDRIGDDGPGGPPAEAPEPPMSAEALRLVSELTERAAPGGGLTPRQARLLERACFALSFASGDPREGIAAFFEGRPARFGPPRPSGPPESPDPRQHPLQPPFERHSSPPSSPHSSSQSSPQSSTEPTDED